ncbi:hypothetical protein [Arthrobacter sp. A2-55]|uniref:hypothetical protein n=1 Tax=Arthrobacter sp. A2-55 TaxID=2897337 RepID=UPI0021CDC25E|nr:hypothetical protein [Arthrobacter sp. A2-55]MCU6480449.1 hypothetical protein [Arthrobacter sp. A2-55]
MADQESSTAGNEARRTPQGELARKLHLLLDVAVAERGEALTFPEIRAAMTVRGVGLSRARWSYMKDGNGRLVQDRPLLTALADYFNVDPEYLLSVEDVETPEMVGRQLEFIKSLRAARVKSFAAKTLGDVSPETLEIIVDYLDQDIALHPGEGPAAD